MHSKVENMYKRIDITLHPDELKKLDLICKERGYEHKSKKKKEKGKIVPNRSAMIARLIQEYRKKEKDNRTLGELTEMDYQFAKNKDKVK